MLAKAHGPTASGPTQGTPSMSVPLVERAHATFSDGSAAIAGATTAILGNWPRLLCGFAAFALMVCIAYVLNRCLRQTRIRSVEGGEYTLLDDARISIEPLRSWVARKSPPEDYRILLSMWLLALLQVADVVSDVLALVTMARNPHGMGYWVTNLLAIAVVTPLVACVGIAGERHRHPALPSTLLMAASHFCQVPSVVLAGLATRRVFWSPLKGKTAWKAEDVEASAKEYSALKAISRQLEAVGLGEATIEAATGLLVQGLYLLQEDVKNPTALYRSLVLSSMSLANAYATLDKHGQAIRTIKHPERENEEVVVVVGCIPPSSVKYVFLLVFRIADIISFIGTCLLSHTAARQIWWEGKPCPVLLCLILTAFLARASLFVSNARSFAALRRAATSMVSFAGPVMLRLSFPFVGLSAMTFYALRALETACSIAFVLWVDPVVDDQRWPLAWTWLCASFAMWPLLAVIAACKPPAPQPEAATALVSNYLQAVLPENRGETPITPWPGWLAPERAAIQAQLAPSPAQQQLQSPGSSTNDGMPSVVEEEEEEPTEFSDLSSLLHEMQADPTLRSVQLSLCKVSDEGAKAIAKQLPCCPQLQRIDLIYDEIGEEGAKAIAEQLLRPRMAMRSVNLRRNHILCSDVNFWVHFLLSTHVTSIHLGAGAFSEFPLASQRCCQSQVQQIQELSLRGVPSPACQSFLLSQVQEVLAIRKLTLKSVGPRMITKLFKADIEAGKGTLSLHSLEELTLFNNGLQTEGARMLVEQLHRCPQLRSLDLSTNRIGPEGKQAVEVAVQAHCPVLTNLKL